MAVVSFLEIWNGRDGEDDDERQRSYRRVFRVVCSSTLDGPVTIKAHAACPAIGTIYVGANGETDTGAFCRKRRCIQSQDDPFVWTVEVEYSSIVVDFDRTNENPLLEPVDIEWGQAQYQKAIEIDLVGDPLESSSGEPYDPPVEIDDSRPVLRISRNLGGFDPALAIFYQDAVNSDVFLGAAPLTAKIMTLTASLQFRNIPYWRVSGEVHFRREGWRKQVLDQGFSHFDSNGVLTKNIDPLKGTPYPHPLKLNGIGELLTSSVSNLSGAIAIGQTLIKILVPGVFPTPDPDVIGGQFVIKIGNEQMLVTDYDALLDRFTVIRGYNGTTQAAHADAAVITMMPYYNIYIVYKELPFAALGFF